MTPTMNRFVAPSSDELEQFARNQVGIGFFLVKGLKKERVLGGLRTGRCPSEGVWGLRAGQRPSEGVCKVENFKKWYNTIMYLT